MKKLIIIIALLAMSAVSVKAQDTIKVYDMSGKLICSNAIVSDTTNITLPMQGVYIAKYSNGKSNKVIMKYDDKHNIQTEIIEDKVIYFRLPEYSNEISYDGLFLI